MIVHLVIVEPETRRGRHKVRLPLLVGRSREAKFRIQEERVSRQHCELSVHEGIVHVRDLGSRNGTLMGGVPVPADRSLPIPAGALVRVGSLGFLVEYDRIAETPTVEFAPPTASSATLAPIAPAPFDVEIRFDADVAETPAPASPAGRPAPPKDGEAELANDELQRFLEGLG